MRSQSLSSELSSADKSLRILGLILPVTAAAEGASVWIVGNAALCALVVVVAAAVVVGAGSCFAVLRSSKNERSLESSSERPSKMLGFFLSSGFVAAAVVGAGTAEVEIAEKADDEEDTAVRETPVSSTELSEISREICRLSRDETSDCIAAGSKEEE